MTAPRNAQGEERKEWRNTTQGTIASNIRSIIKQKGLIQCTVAERAGFTEQQFCDMLAGRKIIRAEFVPTIASALGVDIHAVFEREDSETCTTT